MPVLVSSFAWLTRQISLAAVEVEILPAAPITKAPVAAAPAASPVVAAVLSTVDAGLNRRLASQCETLTPTAQAAAEAPAASH